MYMFSSLSCWSRLLRNNSDHPSPLGSMGNPLFNQASSANLRDHGSNALGAPGATSKYEVPHSNVSINELHSANALVCVVDTPEFFIDPPRPILIPQHLY